MDDWPPVSYGDTEEDGPAPDDVPTPSDRQRERFSEMVGDAWESGTRRDPFEDLDGLL